MDQNFSSNYKKSLEALYDAITDCLHLPAVQDYRELALAIDGCRAAILKLESFSEHDSQKKGNLSSIFVEEALPGIKQDMEKLDSFVAIINDKKRENSGNSFVQEVMSRKHIGITIQRIKGGVDNAIKHLFNEAVNSDLYKLSVDMTRFSATCSLKDGEYFNSLYESSNFYSQTIKKQCMHRRGRYGEYQNDSYSPKELEEACMNFMNLINTIYKENSQKQIANDALIGFLEEGKGFVERHGEILSVKNNFYQAATSNDFKQNIRPQLNQVLHDIDDMSSLMSKLESRNKEEDILNFLNTIQGFYIVISDISDFIENSPNNEMSPPLSYTFSQKTLPILQEFYEKATFFNEKNRGFLVANNLFVKISNLQKAVYKVMTSSLGELIKSDLSDLMEKAEEISKIQGESEESQEFREIGLKLSQQIKEKLLGKNAIDKDCLEEVFKEFIKPLSLRQSLELHVPKELEEMAVDCKKILGAQVNFDFCKNSRHHKGNEGR